MIAIKPLIARTKICKTCGQVKNIDDFSRHRTASDGHRHDCKVCTGGEDRRKHRMQRARGKALRWYHGNKERVKSRCAERRSNPENVEKIKKIVNDRTKKWKDEAFERLGGKCVKCGFSDARALQIDHINGGGCRMRAGKTRSYQSYYRLLVISPDTPDHFQLLCANCNWIKRYEKEEVKTNIFYKS